MNSPATTTGKPTTATAADRICQVNFADQHGGAELISMTLHRGYREHNREAQLHVGVQRTNEPGVQHIDNDACRSTWTRCWGMLSNTLAERGWGTLAKTARAVARPGWAWQRLRGHEDFNHPATDLLIEQLRRDPPSVIHIHNLHGGYFNLDRLPDLCEVAPVVITLHDQWMMLDGAAHADIAPSIRRSPWNLARKDSIYRRCRFRIAAPSQWLLNQAAQSVMADAVIEARCIPNGIDLSAFRPRPVDDCRRELRLNSDSFVVLFVGRAAKSNPAKDFQTVKEAVRRAADLVPARRWTLAVLGDTGRDRSLGAAEIVCLGRYTDHGQIASAYGAADVLAHAAHADTFPTVVLEALGCGRPVVATSVGGIGEQIIDHRTGRLVPRADAEAMAHALAELAVDDEARHAMGLEARQDAEARFSVERMVQDYLDWFDRIATDGGMS
jgi:glycosyltransferase involved in cell wall biosynthesis